MRINSDVSWDATALSTTFILNNCQWQCRVILQSIGHPSLQFTSMEMMLNCLLLVDIVKKMKSEELVSLIFLLLQYC